MRFKSGVVSSALLDDLVCEVFPAAYDDEIESLRESVRPSVDGVILALRQSRAAFRLTADTETTQLQKTRPRAGAVFQRFLRNIESALD